MQRKKAIANIQIDNERIRVTEYSFNRNEETGFHIHQWDYVVITQTNGQLLLIDDNEVGNNHYAYKRGALLQKGRCVA